MSESGLLKALYENWYEQFNYHDDDLRIIICGATRKGKSWRGLKFGEILYSDFWIDRVILDPYSFMDMLDEKAKPGSIVMGDEAGLWAYSREWYTVINRNLAKSFMTCGYLNQGYIVTLPSMKLLDSHVKTLFHYYVETLGISKRRNACKCIIKRIQHNPLTGKTYYKYVRVRHNGRTRTIKNAWIGPPENQDLLQEYEVKNEAEKKKAAIEGKEEMLKDKERRKTEWGKPTDIKHIIEEVRKNINDFTSEYNKRVYLDWKKIGVHYNLGVPTAKRVKAAVEG